MDLLLSLRNSKKSAWLTSAALAFLLSVAVCLFQNQGESLFREPAFWQFSACCLVFFGTAAVIFTMERPWIPLAVTVGGAALVCVFAYSFILFLCAVFLPALLWLLLLRFLAKNERQVNLFRLFSLVLSALLIGVIILLITRIHPLGFSFQFFSPSHNSQLFGLWPLGLLFCLFAVSILTMRKTNNDKKEAPSKHKKKKSGKAKALSRDSFFFISSVLTLLFFTSAALFYAYACLSNDWNAPYALLIDLCGLFVLFGIYRFPVTDV